MMAFLIRASEIGYDNRVDPGSWWQALAKAIVEVVPQDDPLGDIAGISVSSQGPSLIALGKNQEVLCPALMWNDLRAKAEAENLSAEIGRFVSPAWFLPKAIWLKDHHPQIVL
jgi:xylulokinase